MELELKLSDADTTPSADEPHGLRVYFEKEAFPEQGVDNFYLRLNELFQDTVNGELTYFHRGVLLNRESATVLHGFLESILKL